MSRRAYAKNVRESLSSAMNKSGLKEEELQRVVADVFGDERFSTKVDKYKKATTPEQELYNMLIDYKNDLSRMRGERSWDIWDIIWN